MPYVFISYAFVLIFLGLIIYLVYFNIYRRDEIQNSSYNRRQDTQAQYVVRGSILSSDGEVLAQTVVSDGEDLRDYPCGRLFAHAVGYASHGKSGLESLANYDLLTSHCNIIDRVISEFEGERNPGDNVVTTLSARLQQTCYNVLGDYQGAILVMDPATGAILAMVSKPDFDPNTLNEDWDAMVADESGSELVNRATQGLYPPGSVFKIITGLSYYQKYGALDGFAFTCQGELTIQDHTVHCSNGSVHGEEDLPLAFANSCNCAFSTIGLDLGADNLATTAGTLLFGKKLPCDLPYKKSRFTLKEEDGAPAMMQTAFGQGNTLVTPYHMGLVTAAIANGGVLMEPQLISQIVTSDGAIVRENKSSEYRRLLTENEARAMQSLMEGVVLRGTAAELSGLGYSVAGKTGSAEYYLGDGNIGTHSWFVGYSNVEDPDIVVVVLAENGGTGSQTAVPMAHQIFDAYYYG
ncbi:MAG: penicillin-binding transpeptidase domain-containing protein [Lachnospiraceae bacterium]|nr:penicillin-binding transpeptidase domain-containing protein [Lachnospiraceae bacterium]